jgi:hypothetical protein
VALLGLLAALATIHLREAGATLPPAVGSYRALAGIAPAAAMRQAHLSDCGVRILPASAGIETPVLPCGIRLYVSYRGRRVLASVIGHEPVPAGRELDLTPTLAASLRLKGVRTVAWSYAGS